MILPPGTSALRIFEIALDKQHLVTNHKALWNTKLGQIQLEVPLSVNPLDELEHRISYPSC